LKNTIQRKFSPLYLKETTEDWHAKTARAQLYQSPFDRSFSNRFSGERCGILYRDVSTSRLAR
jgi:hypothetical protein